MQEPWRRKDIGISESTGSVFLKECLIREGRINVQGYNLLIAFNVDKNKILMCKRRKPPYQGMINFPGGKIEKGESGLDGAYRELWEETGIRKEDIVLTHLMDFTYYLSDCYLEVYVGRLNKEREVFGEEMSYFGQKQTVIFSIWKIMLEKVISAILWSRSDSSGKHIY